MFSKKNEWRSCSVGSCVNGLCGQKGVYTGLGNDVTANPNREDVQTLPCTLHTSSYYAESLMIFGLCCPHNLVNEAKYVKYTCVMHGKKKASIFVINSAD